MHKFNPACVFIGLTLRFFVCVTVILPEIFRPPFVRNASQRCACMRMCTKNKSWRDDALCHHRNQRARIYSSCPLTKLKVTHFQTHTHMHSPALLYLSCCLSSVKLVMAGPPLAILHPSSLETQSWRLLNFRNALVRTKLGVQTSFQVFKPISH